MHVSDRAAVLIELLQWPGIGQAKARAVLRAVDSVDQVLAHAALLFPAVDQRSREAAAGAAAGLVERCAELGIGAVALGEAGYPSRLCEISDAPPVLFVRGDPAGLQVPGAAVVGTRKASAAGLRSAAVIAAFLSDRGYSIVSGLALGIDAAAHTGALDAGGRTVAVLAHGLDRVSPLGNRELADRVLSNGGALVSEHPPGVPPHRAEYVRRNRIQSGMSDFSVIVETGETGGSIHQAKFTHQQGRPLLTVIPSTEESKRQFDQSGANHLVRSLGAIAVSGTRDLAVVLDQIRDGSLTRGGRIPEQPKLF
jgi:DNA processing protein